MRVVASFILMISICSADDTCTSFFQLKYNDDCTEKTQCVWGKLTTTKCPDTLIFNAEGVCDYKDTTHGNCKKAQMVHEDPCSSGPCENGGSCTSLEDGKNYLCQCQSGFYGQQCQNRTFEINQCDSDPCQNSGICNDWKYRNMYSCSCPVHWDTVVKKCEIYISPHDANPCQNDGLLTESDDGKSFSCICSEEYGGALCEKELSITERCQRNPSLIIPHSNCHQYYNCSLDLNSNVRVRVSPFESMQYLSECPYPQQFSIDTKSCKNFTEVSCGTRHEEKSGCNYSRNMCYTSHCIPCYVNLPSCEGYANGLHEHGSKKDSPWYMICFNERTIYTGMCQYDAVKKAMMFPVNGKCSIKDDI